jgi:hypothetical protein
MENSNFWWYLAEASFCLTAFAGVYRCALASLSSFHWSRGYLLGSLAGSLVLPLLGLPDVLLHLGPPMAKASSTLQPWALKWSTQHLELGTPGGATSAQNWLGTLGVVAVAAYGLGVLLRLWTLGRSLHGLYLLIRRSPRTRLGTYWLVELPTAGQGAFSFGRYVFLAPDHATLNSVERAQLLQHEQVHVEQYHSLDILFAELVGTLMWFHPIAGYLKRELQNVHEYLADAGVARHHHVVPQYRRLLLRLASAQAAPVLSHAFTDKQIMLRLRFLTQPPASPTKKLRYLLMLPVGLSVWLSTASLGDSATATAPRPPLPAAAPITGPKISRIRWQGNTVLPTNRLNQLLGLQPGDVYDAQALASRLNFLPDGRDITSQYMDQGYMYFSLTPTATPQADGTTELTLTLVEGPQVRLRTITLQGTRNLNSQTVLATLPLKSGELFSRAKLMQAQQLLAEMGPFVASQVRITPQPVFDNGSPSRLTDIGVVVVEK